MALLLPDVLLLVGDEAPRPDPDHVLFMVDGVLELVEGEDAVTEREATEAEPLVDAAIPAHEKEPGVAVFAMEL